MYLYIRVGPPTPALQSDEKYFQQTVYLLYIADTGYFQDLLEENGLILGN